MILRRAAVLVAALALLTADAWAAGTLTITQGTGSVRKVTLAWTSDAAGAVSGTTVHLDGVIERVVFVPGTGGVQPTDLYDVTLEDAEGLDLLAGEGANLSNVNKTQVTPFIGDGTTTNKPVAAYGTAELKVAAAGNTKSGTVLLYLR